MLWLLPLWLGLVAILVGWGLLVVWLLRRATSGTSGGALSTFQTMWLGYAGFLCFLELWSVLLPIAVPVIIVACAVAVAGYALNRRMITRRLRTLRSRPRLVGVTACVTLVAWLAVAYAASDLVKWYDTGLYHLQVVKWNATFAAVPGLANLHLRFGYNNSVHLFGAFVDAFWQGVAAHIMNGFLMAALLAQWFSEIFMARSPKARLRQTFCLLTLPFVVAKLWTIEVASLSTDLALAVFCLVLTVELLSVQRGRFGLQLALSVALGAVALTTKLGGLAPFAVTCALALVLVRKTSWRAQIGMFALPAVIVIAWLVHGVIASGWLVFPAFGRLPVSWAVPADTAHAHFLEIQSWSRMFGKSPDQVFGHGFWHWFDTFRQSRECVLLLAASALLAWRIAHPLADRSLGGWAAVAACALGIAQWFLGAPDLRYGGFLFWILLAAIATPMFASRGRDASVRLFVLALSLTMLVWSGGFTPRVDAAVPSLWGRPRYPQTPTTLRSHAGPNTDVLFPTSSDQCFDAELPCTPTPAVMMRDPSSIAAGFEPVP